MIVIDKYQEVLSKNWTFVSSSDGSGRFGSAWEDGGLNLTVWDSITGQHGTTRYHCRSHRQAVRQLRRWVRGQGVTAVRVS